MLPLHPLLQYGHAEAGGVEHIPPGWSFWVGLVRVATFDDWVGVFGENNYNIIRVFPVFLRRRTQNTTTTLCRSMERLKSTGQTTAKTT